MKKNFMQKLMAAAILTVAAVSPSWADYTITKSNGEPAVEGTDYKVAYFMELYTNNLVLSGEFNVAILPCTANYTLTLKDATITGDTWAGALCYQKVSLLNIVLEGTNRIVSPSEGSAIHLYNGASEITFTGSGELYMTSQASDLDVAHSCLYIEIWEGMTGSVTAEGFTIKGSTTYNADINTLTDASIESYTYTTPEYYGEMSAVDIRIGDAVCNTVWMKGPKAGPDLDPDAEYVIVTYKEGSDTKKAYYKTTDVETIEWLKGSDVTE